MRSVKAVMDVWRTDILFELKMYLSSFIMINLRSKMNSNELEELSDDMRGTTYKKT